jgi:hypothetical protein
MAEQEQHIRSKAEADHFLSRSGVILRVRISIGKDEGHPY